MSNVRYKLAESASPRSTSAPLPEAVASRPGTARHACRETVAEEKPAVSRLNARVVGICIAAALGGFLFGFDTAVINGAVDALAGEFELGAWLKGFAVSLALLGCAVGAWFAGPVANKLGRVPTMIIAAAVTIVAILLVDKVGRRPILLAGSVLMTIALGLMALAFSFSTMVTSPDGEATAELDQPWSLIALVAANVFVVGFGASWGPLVWVLLAEMFPNRIRAAALSVATAAVWVANFFISTTFPTFANIGLTFAYGFYATFALLSFFLVYWKIPETKGLELEDIGENAVVKRGKVTPSD